MKKILCYIHGGNNNRGCEAIITSLSKLIKLSLDECEIKVSTEYYDSDIQSKIENVVGYVKSDSNVSKYSYERIYRKILRNLNLKEHLLCRCCKDTVAEIENSDLTLVIGGDTYFKKYGMLERIYFLNKKSRKMKKKNILAFCSIEKDEIDKEMKSDLLGYDLIIARESITYETLKDKGIKDNIKLIPDPAFIMDSEKVNLPKAIVNKKIIIINSSPLIEAYENKNGIVLDSFRGLINHILKSTDYYIVLLPHVDCDCDTNTRIYEMFKENKRVVNLEFGYTAKELKYIISKADMVIAARTHASIAAYSMCIPTLVIGYSVKSLGIARDIFGNEDRYVIPINKLDNEENLIDAFNYIYTEKDNIKKYLEKTMPSYKEKIMELKKEFKSFSDNNKGK